MTKQAVTLQDIVDGQIEISRAMADLATGQEAIAKTLSETTQGLNTLRDYTVSGFETVDSRFDRLEDRFDKLEDRFDTLESTLPYQH